MDQRRSRSYLWLYPVLFIMALGLMCWGIYLMRAGISGHTIFAAGCVCAFATLLVWFHDLSRRAAYQEDCARQDSIVAPINERLQHISVLLNQVSEQQLISERAKAVAFRESERDALRRAIREEMAKRDWDAALALISDIERTFGYRQEADRFREEINAQRELEVRKAVGDAIATIDRHCRAEAWSSALQEAERIIAIYPHDPQALHLPQDIEARRQAFKKQLLESWNDAVARHDVDGSIEILKKLDAYLTPAEASSMQETARQVFKDRLLRLGQQFTLAVKGNHWAESVRVGELIMNEHPNSRMAQEVREKIDLLRQRAASPEAAKAQA